MFIHPVWVKLGLLQTLLIYSTESMNWKCRIKPFLSNLLWAPSVLSYPVQRVINISLALKKTFSLPPHGFQWLSLSTLLSCRCHVRLHRGLLPFNSWPASLFFTLQVYRQLNSPCGDTVLILWHIWTQCWSPGGGMTFPLCPGQHSPPLSLKTHTPLRNKQ